jgi:hypothetical protein
MAEIAFGVFNHIERKGDSLDGLFEGRFELPWEYDAAGLCRLARMNARTLTLVA